MLSIGTTQSSTKERSSNSLARVKCEEKRKNLKPGQDPGVVIWWISSFGNEANGKVETGIDAAFLMGNVESKTMNLFHPGSMILENLNDDKTM